MQDHDDHDNQLPYPPERRTKHGDLRTIDDTHTRSYPPEEPHYSRRVTDIQLLSTKLARLEATVMANAETIKLIAASLPNKSVDEHTAHHEDYARILGERKEKEEEDRKLKKELKDKLIRVVAQSVFVAFMVIMGLGVQAQFAKWVHTAVDMRTPSTNTSVR